MTTHIQDRQYDEESSGVPGSSTPNRSAVKGSASKLKGSTAKKGKKEVDLERPSMGAMLNPDPHAMNIDDMPKESW